MTIDESKQLNLVEFLIRHYGMEFNREGKRWSSFSPFKEERNPSFIVHCRNGQWLYKDFSSDSGGSIIDFIMHKEDISSPSEALGFINRIKGTGYRGMTIKQAAEKSETAYDLDYVYRKIKSEDAGPAYEWLKRRGISASLNAELKKADIVRVNRKNGETYCCFEVRDESGKLRCLDNHQIGGRKKFVLGEKYLFTLDHERLNRSERVFVSEGIVDCLSILDIEGHDTASAALLGLTTKFLERRIPDAVEIISALDADDAGISKTLDLKESFPDKRVTAYDMEDHKDPNELLTAIRSQKRKSLSQDKRMELYEDYIRSENKSEVAGRWGVDRSYMYEIINDCRRFIQEGYVHRRPGRKLKNEPKNMKEAMDRIRELEREKNKAEAEKELYYARSELASVRLKYAELEAAELRGDTIRKSQTDEPRPNKKRHIKKKKKRQR